VYGIACVNISEGDEIRKWIQAQSGVTTVRLSIVEQPVHVYGWLKKQVENRALGLNE
jgi:hypothetical protein